MSRMRNVIPSGTNVILRRFKMPELNDLSGAFKPDLTFNDFSKEFLLRLMNAGSTHGLA